MNTYYIRLVECYDDPVWGRHFSPWTRSPLIRCHRNRRKAVYEWVGSGSPFNLAKYKGPRTVVVYEENCQTRAMPKWIYLKRMPLP